MKKARFNRVVSVIFLFLISCGESSTSNEAEPSKKDQAFYPTAAFIKEQVSKLDSLPLAVFKYTVTEKGTDSVIVPKEELKKAANDFLSPDITVEPLRKMYTETVLNDETSGTITFTYLTNDEDAEVRKAEVYINPNNDKVKGIYIEKIKSGGDSTLIKKLFWKTDRNFQVISIVEKNNQTQSTLQEKYEWDNRN
jgi:hypothetical protein